MKRLNCCLLAVAVSLFMMCVPCLAEQRFADLVGPVKVGEAKAVQPLTMPFITWGGDIPTFYANGGLETRAGTIFAKQGLNLKLVNGDNFVQQVKNYMEGRTPFLRGTFDMIGMASEVIGSDPRTKPVVVFQMTWSTGGDNMVVKQDIKTITDLKGKKVVLQKGGPHVGMLDDILKLAKLTWDDITVVWAEDLSGTPKSPAEMFRKDPSISACFVITPDMVGLTGGLDKIGTSAEGNVKGARVLVSTAQLTRSIADVYVCRKDFCDANRALVEKFAAGYLKACEEVIELKKAYEAGGSPKYKELLLLAQGIFGKDAVPTPDDAHGLLCDCSFVGHPGNVAFFTDKSNPNGFEALQAKVLELATSRGYAKVRQGFFPSMLEWNSPAFIGYLTKIQAVKGERFRAEAVAEEIEKMNLGVLDERTILSFSIQFEPNQDTFSEVQYGSEYRRVIDSLSKFGNAVIAVRGHSDVTKVLKECIEAGVAKGVLKQTGTTGNYRYFFSDGRQLDPTATAEVMRLITEGAFDGASANPRDTMQSALNLSKKRSEAVLDSIIRFAKGQGIEIDKTQVQPVGIGIREPVIPKPRNIDEAKQNMRVEFRLIRVAAEASKPRDFDF